MLTKCSIAGGILLSKYCKISCTLFRQLSFRGEGNNFFHKKHRPNLDDKYLMMLQKRVNITDLELFDDHASSTSLSIHLTKYFDTSALKETIRESKCTNQQ